MKIVICMDSWKGSLSAEEACARVGEGICSARPEAEVVWGPMADGGEGTLELVAARRPGERRRVEVAGPLPGRRVRAGYLRWPQEESALIEMAACAGLPLLTAEERNPMRTTTFGVGELMADAAGAGARETVLALGGSATVDGGAGMAQALGWRFLDARGRDLEPGGGPLRRLARIVPPPRSLEMSVRVMCDVTNPLLGPRGAAAVFGPQKGATPEQVARLEEGLERLAERVERDLGMPGVGGVPGGGAAGGMAAGALAFLGGRLTPGVEEVMRLCGIEDLLREADWVVTGEGRLDSQSLGGKVVSGVLSLARRVGVPVAVVAGDCALSAEDCAREGIRHAISAKPEGMSVEEAMRQAGTLAVSAGRRLADCGCF